MFVLLLGPGVQAAELAFQRGGSLPGLLGPGVRLQRLVLRLSGVGAQVGSVPLQAEQFSVPVPDVRGQTFDVHGAREHADLLPGRASGEASAGMDDLSVQSDDLDAVSRSERDRLGVVHVVSDERPAEQVADHSRVSALVSAEGGGDPDVAGHGSVRGVVRFVSADGLQGQERRTSRVFFLQIPDGRLRVLRRLHDDVLRRGAERRFQRDDVGLVGGEDVGDGSVQDRLFPVPSSDLAVLARLQHGAHAVGVSLEQLLHPLQAFASLLGRGHLQPKADRLFLPFGFLGELSGRLFAQFLRLFLLGFDVGKRGVPLLFRFQAGLPERLDALLPRFDPFLRLAVGFARGFDLGVQRRFLRGQSGGVPADLLQALLRLFCEFRLRGDLFAEGLPDGLLLPAGEIGGVRRLFRLPEGQFRGGDQLPALAQLDNPVTSDCPEASSICRSLSSMICVKWTTSFSQTAFSLSACARSLWAEDFASSASEIRREDS